MSEVLYKAVDSLEPADHGLVYRGLYCFFHLKLLSVCFEGLVKYLIFDDTFCLDFSACKPDLNCFRVAF